MFTLLYEIIFLQVWIKEAAYDGDSYCSVHLAQNPAIGDVFLKNNFNNNSLL